jgi:MFS family permease
VSARGKFHYAWIVAGVTFFVLLVAAGVRTAGTVLITPLEQEFGWSRSSISLAIAISIAWYGLGGPLAGTSVDRFGPRRVMLVGLGLICAGLWGLLTISSLWGLHLYLGLVVGIGTGAVANVLGATIALRWFTKNRGMVLGVFSASSAAGQLIFLPTLITLTDLGGWRIALELVAIVIALMLLPVFFLMRDQPEQIGQRAYGDDGSAQARSAADLGPKIALGDAIHMRDFWLLAGSFFICGYTTNGLIGTHLLPHAIEHGFTNTVTAGAIGLMGAMNIIGTLASGWLSDRYDNRVLLAFYYSARALGIAILPLVGDSLGLIAFAILYGLDWVATVPPTVNLTAQRFGRASVGQLYGWIFFSHMMGAAVAAYLGGVMRETLGDYSMAFFSAALLGFIAAAFSMSIARVRRPLQARTVAS